MARLCLIVEGPTEQVFAARLLIPHLAAKGVHLSKPELAVHARRGGVDRKGGVLSYPPFRNQVVRRLKEDKSSDVFFSTMIDLYALPKDFPGFETAAKAANAFGRVALLEEALKNDLGDARFIPYIQLHEFEALVLSFPKAFACYYDDRVRQIERLTQLCAEYDTPEKIDDGEHTAPSKRIGKEIPDYLKAKRTAGPIIAAHIGLEKIRNKCPHFKEWLTKLERLGAQDRSE